MNRILDLVLTRLSDYNVSVIQPLLPISIEDNYHPALLIHLSKTSRLSKCKNESLDPIVHSYNFKKANFNLLYTLLTLVDWNFLNHYQCINMALQQFYSVLYDILDTSVPKSLPFKTKYPFWFTKTIIDNIKLKNSYLNRFKRYGNISDFELFRTTRQIIKSEIHNARRNYIRSVEQTLKLNPKTFWSYYRNKNATKSSSQMYYNNCELLNDIEVAEAFKNYFSSVYSNSSTVLSQNNESNLCITSVDLIKINYISHAEIENSIKSLKASSSAGLDLIPAFIIKANRESFIYPLIILFNLSLSLNIFPDIWKASKIIPIFKKGKKKKNHVSKIITRSPLFLALPNYLKVLFTINYQFRPIILFLLISMVL